MSEHLSALALDEAAASLPLGADAQAHVQACAQCRARIEALKADNARVLASPHGVAVRNELVGRHAAKAARPSRRWILPALSALAAAVVLFVFVPRPSVPSDQDRLKGSPAIAVLRDGTTITSARVGERVGLQLSPAGLSHAAVFAVDDGEVVRLWPRASESMARLKREGIVTLDDAFEVTAGSVTLHAAFAAKGLPLAELEEQLRGGRTDDRVRWAKTTLEVP